MRIEDVKGWMWAVLGLLVGLAFSGVLVASGPWFDTQSLDTIGQGEFEGRLVGQSPRNEGWLVDRFYKGKTLLRNVVVHPPFKGDPSHAWWVSGEACDILLKPKDPKSPSGPRVAVADWMPFKYEAAVPYVPGYASEIAKAREQALRDSRQKRESNGRVNALSRRVAPTEAERAAFGNQDSFPNVLAYLKAAHGVKDQNFSYQFAYWDLPALQWTLPPLAGLLLIGVAWPLTLTALATYGMARPPKTVKVAKPAPVPTSAPTRPTAAVAVIKPPEPPSVPPPPPDGRKFGGEFYPVAKNAAK